MKINMLLTVLIVGLALMLSTPILAADIDFGGLLEGQIVSEVSSGAGVTGPVKGTIGIFGHNPSLDPANSAVIFDSSCPPGGVPLDCSGEDVDLGTPNQILNGPGVGDAGEVTNTEALGNILIVAEDLVDIEPDDGLVDDPDDAVLQNAYLLFDFRTTKSNGKGTVTVNSITVMDVETEEVLPDDAIELFRAGVADPSTIAIPPIGDNGVLTLEPGLDNVTHMFVRLNGSGAVASAIINEKIERDCWVTSGGFHNATIEGDNQKVTFGGNVGPPSSGALEVVDHSTGDNFHTNDIRIVRCFDSDTTGPQQPGGKKGLEVDTLEFECDDGRLNGVSGHTCTGFFIDGGEPAGKKGNDPDFFEIHVFENSTEVFTASGELTNGNVQIHPPVGP